MGILCRLFHKHYPNLLWNGSRQRWMLWCDRCGEWRTPGRARLEAKMAAIMEERQ